MSPTSSRISFAILMASFVLLSSIFTTRAFLFTGKNPISPLMKNKKIFLSSSSSSSHFSLFQQQERHISSSASILQAAADGEDDAPSTSPAPDGYKIDLTGKIAFIAGVADANGYGWAIAKALAEAGATIIVGTWPPVLGIFKAQLDGGRLEKDLQTSTGGKWNIDKIYPLDAVFDTPEDVPEEISSNKRYAGLSGYTIEEVATGFSAFHSVP